MPLQNRVDPYGRYYGIQVSGAQLTTSKTGDTELLGYNQNECRLSDDPIRGFGERIIKRARLPTAALLALPFLAILTRYFLFLVDHQFEAIAALEQLKKDVAAFAFLGGIPTIVLAFFRELQVHQGLDRLLRVRRRVDGHIAELMATLATSSGYDYPERIVANRAEARHGSIPMSTFPPRFEHMLLKFGKAIMLVFICRLLA